MTQESGSITLIVYTSQDKKQIMDALKNGELDGARGGRLAQNISSTCGHCRKTLDINPLELLKEGNWQFGRTNQYIRGDGVSQNPYASNPIPLTPIDLNYICANCNSQQKVDAPYLTVEYLIQLITNPVAPVGLYA